MFGTQRLCAICAMVRYAAVHIPRIPKPSQNIHTRLRSAVSIGTLRRVALSP